MRHLSPTRFGKVEPDLASAARHTIAVVAAPGLLVLDDVHLHLGIRFISMGTVPIPERPSDRWSQLMRELFCFNRSVGDENEKQDLASWNSDWSPPTRRVRGLLARSNADEQLTLCRLLTAAATFLVAERLVLEDSVQIAGAVHHRKPRPFELTPTELMEKLLSVVSPARRLLDHAEPEKLAHLLPRQHGLREHECCRR